MVIIAGTVTTLTEPPSSTLSGVEITSQGADDDFGQETSFPGMHTITFTRAFGAAPSVVVSAQDAADQDRIAVVQGQASADYVEIEVLDRGRNLAPYGYSFSFIAVGVAGEGQGGGPA